MKVYYVKDFGYYPNYFCERETAEEYYNENKKSKLTTAVKEIELEDITDKNVTYYQMIESAAFDRITWYKDKPNTIETLKARLAYVEEQIFLLQQKNSWAFKDYGKIFDYKAEVRELNNKLGG